MTGLRDTAFSPNTAPRRYAPVAAAILILIFAVELATTVHRQSLSWDEGDHIFAGYMSWEQHDFGINPEHPPLVKAIATIPMLFMHLNVPPPKGLDSFKNEAYMDGRDLLFNQPGNQPQREATADTIIFRDRMFAASISMLLALLVFLAAQEMFGSNAALFALTLVVFEPNLIAHGAYVTTDMGVSCFLFASVYTFYRYVKLPSWPRILLTGLAGGCALAAKHSAVLVLPMILLLALSEVLITPAGDRRRKSLQIGGGVIAASAIAIFLLWAVYGFRFAARPHGLHMHPSLAEYVSGLHGFEPKIYLFFARFHLLPESYLFGLADVRLVSISFPSYIFGKIYAHGVWFYFPAAFLVKSTAAFLVLLLVSLFALAARKVRCTREVLFLLIPPGFYMAVAMASGLNIGARHILPMYAFLCVLISGVFALLARSSRPAMYAALLLLVLHIVSSVRAYPYAIAYSNEFWGGPDKTYKYLTDSNVDWGQNLKGVQRYVAEHNTQHCYFAYFVDNAIRPADYGIPCKQLPTADTGWFDDQVDTPPVIDGPVFISAGTLTGYEFGSNVLNPYRDFQKLKPDAVIEHGVFVYNGSFPVPLASALGHVTRANRLAAAHQYESALAEAKLAVATDPDAFQAQMALGDTLTAMGRKAEALPAYEKALGIAQTMEPAISAEWTARLQQKLSATK
jgi:hypothetical protein